MREKSKIRKTKLVFPMFILTILLVGGSLFAYQWVKPIVPAAAFLNDQRQNANRVGDKFAADSRLRRRVIFNDFVADVVCPMIDKDNQTLVAPRIEFESNVEKISELAFMVYQDSNGNFVADEDEPMVMKWNETNVAGKKGEEFAMEDRLVSEEMLEAVNAGTDFRFSCRFAISGGSIETHGEVQVKE